MLATGEVKCIDEEIPFEIPKGWEWCRLNDLALYRKGPFGSSLTKSMFVAKSNQSIKVMSRKMQYKKTILLAIIILAKKSLKQCKALLSNQMILL